MSREAIIVGSDSKPPLLNIMDLKSFVYNWCQEKFRCVATQLQDEKDKVALLESKVAHQQIALDTFSKEKHDMFLKVNAFVDEVRASVRQNEHTGLSINDQKNTVDYWKNLYFSNYALGSTI